MSRNTAQETQEFDRLLQEGVKRFGWQWLAVNQTIQSVALEHGLKPWTPKNRLMLVKMAFNVLEWVDRNFPPADASPADAQPVSQDTQQEAQ